MADHETQTPKDAELDERFPYDDRPVHHEPEQPDPFLTLSGRGQTEGTPMGLGPVLGWGMLVVFALFLLFAIGVWLLSVIR